MSQLKAIGLVVSNLVGIGLILLPYLFQQSGLFPALLIMSAVAILLNIFSYVLLDLIDTKGMLANIEAKLKYKQLVPLSLLLVSVGAMASYIFASGQQLFAWLNIDPHYGSALFFVLAALLILWDFGLSVEMSMNLGLLLMLALLVSMGVSTGLSVCQNCIFGTEFNPILLISVSAFALFGHFAMPQVIKLAGSKEAAKQAFFSGFFLAFIFYVLYGTLISTVAIVEPVSTASLALIFPPALAALISLTALLAFYTSFIGIGVSTVHLIRDEMKMPKKASVILVLLLPALLYISVREYALLSIIELVGKFGGGGVLLFSALVCYAHSKSDTEKSIPSIVSKTLFFLFLTAALCAFIF
ncbi:MAG: hypothetical protein GOU99_01045 [Candidatus Altiarchaeota archaeon]|nr:hypothetical protein [Candidatus Altiarchaeota archaeon]